MGDLEGIIRDRARSDGAYAIAWAVLQCAHQLRALGNADAATPMGAIEGLGAVLKETLAPIADIGDGLQQLAQALDKA